MNIQTDPERLKRPLHRIPALADVPIRSNFFHEDRLAHLGESLAKERVTNFAGLDGFDFAARNRENAERILEVYRSTNAAQARGETITPAAQWLLDNYYRVDETVFQIKRDLPRKFYAELPTVAVAPGKSAPRALALAWIYVAHTDSSVSADTFKAIVEGYQSEQPLRIGELWALPSLLRFVLIENLRRLALRVRRSHEMRQIANDVADRVLASNDGDDRRAILSDYTEHARDTSFATQLLYRLRDGSQNAGKALGWLEGELEKSGSDSEEIIIREHHTLSSGNVTTGNIIRGLRLINDIDWSVWFESVSRVDRLLRARTDFAALDFPSRDQYRAAIEDLSRRSDLPEYQVAERALSLAETGEGTASGQAPADATQVDAGFFLVGPRRQDLERAIGYRPTLGRRFGRAFCNLGWVAIVLPVVALTMLLLGMTAAGLVSVGLPDGSVALLLLLFAIPAGEGALGFFNTIILLFLKPTRLVGYEYKEGLPREARTLVVVPTLIGSRDDVDETARNLEVHHLANMKGDVFFAILSDWPDSHVEQSAEDLELLAYAKTRIAMLNAKYPPHAGHPRFHLLHRRRLYNETHGMWMGWERKRGKLHELNLLLRGDADTTFLPREMPLPEGFVHVMTLDSDTRMTRDAVTRLVGKMRHPLNQPHAGPSGGLVRAGYAIMQPRVTPSLTTGDEASFFQRVFSSNRGLDPYVFAVSDVYQDLFGEGSFTGKGLYHIDAFEAALKGRIPENAVLSHDLLEGALARSALVTDVELIEDYPTRYAVDASRQHRWARGDWQLLPFIFDPGYEIPALSRWKMIDNLRRSLTPIFWVIASIAGWALLPFTLAVQWQALLIVSQFMAPTFNIVDSVAPTNSEATARGHFSALARDTAFGTALVALRTVLIAHSAWMMGDAIVRTLYRLFVSRRYLLEWRTASQAQKSGGDLESYYRQMFGAVVIAVAGLAIPIAAGSTGTAVALIFCGFWALSPAFAWLISRSAETEDRLRISATDTAKLRAIARQTWLYFETFVTAEHNDLPPDNFQETPFPAVANRTSPTNIGVYLLATVSARDFGWISMTETGRRIGATLDTVERMQRYRGHLYNWYDTRSLEPLFPLYVSSVDSGNLAGHLIAVAAALREWAEAPAVYLQGDFDGLLDAVTALEDSLAALPDDRRQLRPLRQRLRDRIDGMRRAVDSIKSEPEMAAIRTINLAVVGGEIRKLADSIRQESGSEPSERLADWAFRLEATAEAHVNDSHTDDRRVRELRAQMQELAERARKLAFEMDFAFLLRPDRKLLSIGYRVEEHQLDESCYDLLASEARLTSLFAIAKGDIPTEHWFRLGRPIVEIGFRGALVSWSGSMFEYLMPPLVMKEPQGGILNQTSRMVIKRQIQYGRSKGIPWGISEAAYNARDREMTYQYTNFGVPGLGLKRGLARNTVIAPYATVLASQFTPEEAVENLERLASIGALGRYGYYDAVDYTPQRVPEGAKHAIVANYMAHHQGMSIVAVANAVFEGRMRDRFHSDPVIEAAELLLQEKAPRDIPVAVAKTEAGEPEKVDLVEISPDTRIVARPLTGLRATNLMSNGRYSVMVTAAGSGYSRWNDLSLTRWRPDPVEDKLGSYLFLRDLETDEWWSATAEPKQAPDEFAQALFSDDKASFIKVVGKLRSEVECIVVSEGNGEGRRLTLVNDGLVDRHIEVTSYGELVLAPEAADSAHPAFSKMFVETEINESRSAIFARRRPRAANETGVAAAHFATDAGGAARDAEAETDRRAFIGRGRTLATAAAFDPGARLTGGAGFTLDPILSLRRRLRVPANKKVTLTFWTVIAADREEVEATVARLNHPESFARQAMLSWTRSQVQTRHVGLTLADAANVQKLACHLIYPDSLLRTPDVNIAAGLARQSSLWSLSISGDFPIFAVRVSDVADLEIVAQALRIQEYMRARGLVADLVIINEQASSYVQDLQTAIEALCENSRLRGKELGPRQHIFAVRRDLMEPNAYKTLLAVARVALHTRNGTIFDQIERADVAAITPKEAAAGKVELLETGAIAPKRATAEPLTLSAASPKVSPPVPAASAMRSKRETPKTPPVRPADGSGLAFWNGFGGFDRDGRDYVVRLTGRTVTPQPWINVVSNANFGFHTSAEGASFTWSRNSRDFQLTPWTNDPVVNRPGEAIYVFDHASRKAFSPCAAVARDPSMTYEARHGQGVCSFGVKRGPLEFELTQIVDPLDPVKITRLRIRNAASTPARLRVYAYAEWVLGSNRAKSGPTVIPSRDGATGALLARNPYSLEFGERVAFLAGDGQGRETATADRREFLGAAGDVEWPAAVVAGDSLSGLVRAGMDPCAALSRDVDIPANGEVELFWYLGDAESPDEASALIQRHRARDFGERLALNEETWRGFLDTLQVETPDKALDAMVNHWLPYQSLACRIRARSAFYQASGAFGFRDQLQDTLALLLHDPKLAHSQILNAARRQFAEGDVQHWWLPRTGAGVRTMISDDVVWLAFAVATYLRTTGDRSILQEPIPFIEGRALEPGQHDAFYTPEISQNDATLFEHCARALDLAIARRSENGLPLILGGDWNDGMNRVGEEGRGESVWLGWFLLRTLREFAPIALEEQDRARSERWQAHADALKAALEATAWDGAWYRRGSFDDGSPLGSHLSDECQIDSIAQSWSVLSGEADPERSSRAMTSAMDRLVDDEAAIVRLFTPPFEKINQDPGYIKSYPPGVRENGGQYTHAATWFVIALADMGRVDDAYRCFSMLNPVNHALDPAAAERYRVEPFVVAADIYSGGEKAGRGGWTWYTGSAGWLYRAAVEGILGLHKEGSRLIVEPALPSHWEGFSATLKLSGTVCRIKVVRSESVSGNTIEVDGLKVEGHSFEVGKGSETDVTVTIPAAMHQS